jgi:hypothetical protein
MAYLQLGCCHPSHAMRTKCACGVVIRLSGAFGRTVVQCECGRKHRKNSDPRGSFATGKYEIDRHISTGKREGGKAGCPGIAEIWGDGTKAKRRRPAGGNER